MKQLWGFRPQATKKSDIERGRERQEFLWASGKETDSTWYEALKREHEAIMHGIEVEWKKKTSSTTLNGSHDAGLPPSSSLSTSATPPSWKLNHSRSKSIASKSESHLTASKLGSNKHGTGGRSQIADSSSLLTAETPLRPSSSTRSHSSSTRPPSPSTRSPSPSTCSPSTCSPSTRSPSTHSPSTRSPSASVNSSSHWSSRIPHHSEDIMLLHRTTVEDRPLGSIGGRAAHEKPPFVVQLPSPALSSSSLVEEEGTYKQPSHCLYPGTPEKKSTFICRLKGATRPKFSPQEQKETDVVNMETITSDLHASESARESEEKPETQNPRPPTSSTSSSDIQILSELARILEDKVLYKKLLSCPKPEAQTVLEVLQMLLDTRETKGFRRRQLITAMRRISKKTQLFPLCFNIYGSMEVRRDPSGGGGYADVYEARVQNEHQDERLCLKVIRVYARSSAERIAKIYAREAITWGQLYHPNVLPFYGLYEYRNRVSLVAPWAENGHLGNYLKRNPELNPTLLCSDAATGLSYLHKHSIVHGNIKAVNVLVDHSGRACLGDLGLSSVTDPEIVDWTSQSSAASKGGSTRWQAPELHEAEPNDTNKVHNSKASDIFAWACLCYEAFTGKIPFYDIRSTGVVINSIIQGKHPSKPPVGDPAWTRRELTTGIWVIMEDCWKLDPQKRPDISMVIARLKSELPVDTRPPPQWQGRCAREFRYQQSAGSTHRQPTLEDLDAILSGILSE